MQRGVTVALATVWLAVAVGVVGAATPLHPSHRTLDQYSPLPPYRHGIYGGAAGEPNPKDRWSPEDQALDLAIGSRRSILANGPPRRSFEVEYNGEEEFESLYKDTSPLIADSSLSRQSSQSQMGRGTKFAKHREVDYEDPKGRQHAVSHQENLLPLELDDTFVADDTFQDQGPGSVEIYKLDLFKEKTLLNPTPTARSSNPRSKSKVPKKTSRVNTKSKTVDYKSTISPKTHRRSQNFFEIFRTSEQPPPNGEAFGVGGVPELQVGCEGLEASSSHKLKRSVDSLIDAKESVDTSTKVKEEPSTQKEALRKPAALDPSDLDYDFPIYEEEEEGNYEEMDELLRLRNLETTTKQPKQSRGDMDATVNSEFFDSSKHSEKLPVRGDLGKLTATASDRQFSLASSSGSLAETARARRSNSDGALVVDEEKSLEVAEGGFKGPSRRLLWLDDSLVRGDGANEERPWRLKRAVLWGFGEDEGAVSSDELQSENRLRQREDDRRRQEYERRRQDEARRRHYGEQNRTNSQVDRIRTDYEKMLEQKEREEEERRRRMQEVNPRQMVPDSWRRPDEEEERRRQQEERRRQAEQRRREHEEEKGEEKNRRNMQQRSRGGRHEEMDENQRRMRQQEMMRLAHEKWHAEERRKGQMEELRKRNDTGDEARRRGSQSEDARRRAHEIWHREEARRRQEQQDPRRRIYPRPTPRPEDRPRSTWREMERGRMEEKRRRDEAEKHEALRRERDRWLEVERRRQEGERNRTRSLETPERNPSADERRRLEERQHEWLMKRRLQEREEEERRKQDRNRNEPPSNLVRSEYQGGHNASRAYDRRQQEEERNRRLRERDEREREKKLREYVERNRPINMRRGDSRIRQEDANRRRQEDDERRKQEEEHRRVPSESPSSRQNATRTRQSEVEYRRRMDEQRRHEEERKLQEYIRRNQPVTVSSRTNESSQDSYWQRRPIETAREMDGSRGYPTPEGTGRRPHGPSAPANIEARGFYDEARRREEERRSVERQRYYAEAEERRKEAARREDEYRRIQSRKYEEDRKRMEAARQEDERKRQQALEEQNRRAQAARARTPERDRPEYQNRHVYQEQRRAPTGASLIPSNLVLDERRRAMERERQRQEHQRRMMELDREREVDRRKLEADRMKNERDRGMVEYLREREEARLKTLPVSARIILQSRTSPYTAPPVVPLFSRAGFENDVDFLGIHPGRQGVQAGKFPVAPTERPPAEAPPSCVWAVVRCCSSNYNRRFTCFESAGCPGVNWDSNPCSNSVMNAAREQLEKFYDASESDRNH